MAEEWEWEIAFVFFFKCSMKLVNDTMARRETKERGSNEGSD